jgi:hypothetical protein
MAKILIVAALATFSRRGLTTAAGVPAIIKKGEAFKVSDELGDELTSGDYCNYDADGNPIPHFKEADEGTKLAYDFTADKVVNPPADRPTTTVEKSLEGLDEVTIAEKVQAATPKAVRSQRVRAK